MTHFSTETPSTSDLRLRAKEMHFHLRALDISITELQHQLTAMASGTTSDEVLKNDGPAPPPSALKERLLEVLDRRHGMLLAVHLLELEIEMEMQREQLGAANLLPRCPRCFTGGGGNDDARDERWPIRRDSLMAPTAELMLPPLRVRGKALGLENISRRNIRISPAVETRVDPRLHRQRSLMGLVRKLTAQKSMAPLATTTKPN